MRNEESKKSLNPLMGCARLGEYMNKDYTHITFVMDRSGSMATCWSDVVGGYETFIKEQKEGPGKCTFTLNAFDTMHDTPLNFADVNVVSESLEDTGISPRGGTALYDAIGKAINETGAALKAMKEDDRPSKVMVVVQTDGEENSSREFKASMIKEMITKQEKEFDWAFMFIGASAESVTDAVDHLGFSANTTAHYDTKNTTEFYGQFSQKLCATRSADDMTKAKSAITYTTQERSALTD